MNDSLPTANTDSATTEASSTQQAYQTIRRMIVMAELKPGEKLKINRLKELLNTGASPIREALSLLTSDQLVERIDQRGFRTAEASRENFNEILALRCSLEDMAIRQSIENASTEWEENLVLCHHRMVKEQRDKLETFEQLHKDFHTSLLANCGSPILLKFCNQLYDLNVRYRYIAGRSQNYQSRDVSEEHQNILQAAIDRNAEAASTRLLSHYRKTGVYLAGLFS